MHVTNQFPTCGVSLLRVPVAFDKTTKHIPHKLSFVLEFIQTIQQRNLKHYVEGRKNFISKLKEVKGSC